VIALETGIVTENTIRMSPCWRSLSIRSDGEAVQQLCARGAGAAGRSGGRGYWTADWFQERFLIKQGDWNHACTSEVRRGDPCPWCASTRTGCAITASPSWPRAGTWGNCWASTPRCCELDRGREAGYASGRPGHDEFGRRYGQTAAVGSRSLRVAAGAVRPSGTGCREW